MRSRARGVKTGEVRPDGDLNLVPIMNLIVCLVPIVLLGASVVKVGAVHVNAPMFGPPGADCCEAQTRVSLSVGSEGFRVVTTGPDADADSALPMVPKVDGDYDLPGLYRQLAALRDRLPGQTTVYLSADPTVELRTLIRTMDAVRLRLDLDASADRAAFQSALPRYDAKGQAELLFPDVVFAVAR